MTIAQLCDHFEQRELAKPKRRTAPIILTPAEIKALVSGLAIRERTLVLLAATTGFAAKRVIRLKVGRYRL